MHAREIHKATQPGKRPALSAEHRQPPAAAIAEPAAVQVVWQWLTYGLWLWTLVALSALLTSTLAFFIVEGYDNNFSIYVLAATLCLLPLAFVVDRIYSRSEPVSKRGFAAVVMVLHAVLAFLFLVASLVTAVIAALSLVLNASSPQYRYVTLLSSIIVFALSLLFFARVMRPARFRRALKYFPWAVVGITAAALVLTAIGPFAQQVSTRDDRLIEANLPTVNNAIQNYTQTNGHLPALLSDLTFSASEANAQALVSRQLVRYRQLTTMRPATGNNSGTGIPPAPLPAKNTGIVSPWPPALVQPVEAHYELCVTWHRAKNPDANDQPTPVGSSGSYPAYFSGLEITSHPAGDKCYELAAYISQP